MKAEMNDKKKQTFYDMSVSKVYPLYIKKVEKKGRTKAEVDQVIRWLTGYTDKGLKSQLDKNTTFKGFFEDAPGMNPARRLITGVICGVRVEDIKDPVVQSVRYLDKLVDELAKGKTMEKILRK